MRWRNVPKTCYPEWFAQEALGHNGKAVHRSYARKAPVVIPTLQDYERKLATAAQGVIVPMPPMPAQLLEELVNRAVRNRLQDIMNKLKKLKALGRKRKLDRWKGYKCIGDYARGKYECDFVSPYTKSAKNVDSPIMVLLQDWSSDKALKPPFNPEVAEKGYYPPFPTNRRLIELLKVYFNRPLNQVFATNLFPFIKMGGISATIPERYYVEAAKQYAIPQIKIVCPKLVICLGLATFNALRIACEEPPVYPMESAIRNPFKLGTSRIWCQAHTGARGQSNRGRDRVAHDWKRMRKAVRISRRTHSAEW